MILWLKNYLKKYPAVITLLRLIIRINWRIRDFRSAYLSKSTKMKITPYGFKLIGSNSVHHLAMQNGTFEPEETVLFQEYFQSIDVFVDVGANIGFYSCLARSLNVGVVAIEPLQRNLKYLYANFVANGWRDVEVFPVGLSELPGLATLYGGSSTGASMIGGWAGALKMFQRTIPLTKLDIILGNRFDGKKLLIKIDVEGFEYSVLNGAFAAMDMQPRPVWIVEICLNEYHPDGINPHFKDTFNLFLDRGYEIRTANKENKLIRDEDVADWVASSHCDSGTINYVFLPRNLSDN